MPLLLIHNSNLNSVDISLYIKTGSAYESPQNNGISHLLEHLLIAQKGKPYLKKHFPFNLEIKGMSGKDFVYFSISHHKDYAKEMLKVLLDNILQIKFKPQELENEKNIISEEINEKEENPFEILEEEIDKIFYHDSLNLPILGTKETVNSLTLEEIKKWYFRFYNPANMILAVSGNFDPGYILKKTESRLSNFEFRADKKEFHLPKFKCNDSSGFFEIKKNKFSQTYLGLVFPAGKGMRDEKYFQYLLLANLMEKKISTQRQENGEFYDVDIVYRHFLHTGEFRIITSFDREKNEKADQKLLRQLKEIEISGDFFEKIKELTAREFKLRQDNLEDLSSLALYKLAGRKKIFTPEEEAKKIEEIEYETIKKLKKQIFSQNNCYIFKMK